MDLMDIFLILLGAGALYVALHPHERIDALKYAATSLSVFYVGIAFCFLIHNLSP